MIKTVKHQDKEYEIFNGLVFDKGTNERVMEIISANLNNRERIRIFYGNANDGIDWCETYDTIGYIGSTRPSSAICGGRFPLLIKSKRSIGGDAIMCDNILKITKDKKTLYVHPKYSCGIEIREISDEKYKYELVNKISSSSFVWKVETLKSAEIIRDFFLGKRNNYISK